MDREKTFNWRSDASHACNRDWNVPVISYQRNLAIRKPLAKPSMKSIMFLLMTWNCLVIVEAIFFFAVFPQTWVRGALYLPIVVVLLISIVLIN